MGDSGCFVVEGFLIGECSVDSVIVMEFLFKVRIFLGLENCLLF